MAVHFFAIDLTFLLRKKDAVGPLGKSMGKVEPAADGKVGAALQRASETKQRAYAAMKKYVISVLPSVYHPVPWLRRLKEQLFHHHKYISLFTSVLTLVRHVQRRKRRRTAIGDTPGHEGDEEDEEDEEMDTAVSATSTAGHVGVLGRQGGRRGGFSLGRDLEKATDEKPGNAREKAEDGVSRAEPVLSSSVAVVGRRARHGPATLRRMSWRRVFTVVKLALKTPTVTKDIRVARSACLEMWVKLHEMGLYG
eukprot:gene20150-14713_t